MCSMPKPIEKFLSAGAFASAIDLSDTRAGFPTYGWLREDALKIVDEAESAHVVILGGDIWSVVSGRIEPAYANWFEDVGSIKPNDDDVARCAEKARRYISSYPAADAAESEAVFEFVFGETSLGH